MGIRVKGVNLKGLQVRGAEFLEPGQIASCRGWYKWKTGITLDGSSKVQQWDDQIVGNHMTQPTTTRRPSYDTDTGLITTDGSDDYLYAPVTLTGVNTYEFVFVVNTPSGYINLCTKSRQYSADADNLIFSIVNSAGLVDKRVASGSGAHITTSNGPGPGKHIYDICTYLAYVAFDGVEASYSQKISGGVNDINTSGMRIMLGAANRGSGGVGGSWVHPTSYSYCNIHEMCWWGRALNTLERTKLTSYLKVKHGID